MPNSISVALLKPGEAAQILGVNTNTVARWARAGRLAAVRTPGGHRRFRPEEVDRVRRERAASRA